MSLRLDWALYASASFACKNWHYSKSVPAGASVKIGVWENDIFKGVIIFLYGATPNIAKPYGLTQTQCVELTRVALREHKTPVTRMIAIAIKMLKRLCPGVRLIVSYADKDQNHTGGIYKGGGWIYEGLFNEGCRGAFIVKNKKIHPKSIYSKFGKGAQNLEWVKKNMDAGATEWITQGKHKYLMPLDDEMRAIISKRSKPYPCVGGESITVGDQLTVGGANPTPALQEKNGCDEISGIQMTS